MNTYDITVISDVAPAYSTVVNAQEYEWRKLESGEQLLRFKKASGVVVLDVKYSTKHTVIIRTSAR